MYEFTDSGQALAACREALSGRYIHVRGVGWLRWDGRVWAESDEDEVTETLRGWTDTKARAAPTAEFKDWARRLDAPKLRNALMLTRGMPGIAVPPKRLDASPDVLNVGNGVVHLPTGELMPHNPDLYLTKIADVEYDKAAAHPDWDAALAAIPESVRPWLQMRYGQAITGHACPDDRLVIQQGAGSNGKSTILTGISAALGDYYHQAPARLLIGGQNNGHSADLADLRGRRFVAVEETPEAGRLDVVMLKTVAGTPQISARKLYKDPVSFTSTHTLFVNTNYTPVVGETDEGTWRRLLLVCFPYTFTTSPSGDLDLPGDPHLRDRLTGLEQRQAALAWLVAGARHWYENGREFGQTPYMVVSDTDEWRGRTDNVLQFWEDHLDADPDSYVWSGDLIWFFNNYMRQHGNAGISEQTFWRRFAHHASTTGALVSKRRIRQGRGLTLRLSRPTGALDPFSRLPGVPEGQISAWVGIRFRRATDAPSDLGIWENRA